MTVTKTEAPFLWVHSFCHAAQLPKRGRVREKRYGKIHTEVYCFLLAYSIQKSFSTLYPLCSTWFSTQHIGEFNHEFLTSPRRLNDISRITLENPISMWFTCSLLRKYWLFPYFFQIFREANGDHIWLRGKNSEMQSFQIKNKDNNCIWKASI